MTLIRQNGRNGRRKRKKRRKRRKKRMRMMRLDGRESVSKKRKKLGSRWRRLQTSSYSVLSYVIPCIIWSPIHALRAAELRDFLTPSPSSRKLTDDDGPAPPSICYSAAGKTENPAVRDCIE